MKKLLEKLAILIDKSGKILSRFKIIGAIILLTMLILSFINNGCSRQEANELFEQVTGLNIKNDLLRKDIEKRQQEGIFKDMTIATYRARLKVKEDENEKLKNDNNRLKRQRERDLVDIISIPVDSSYSFLTKVAYPYKGELKYPFNEPQVKFIHLTYLERLNLQEQNDNLVSQITNYESQLLLKDTIYEKKIMQLDLANKSISDYEEIIINKDEEIALKDQELAKKGNGLLWKIAVGVLAVITIVK